MNVSSRRNEIAIQVKVPWTNEGNEIKREALQEVGVCS